MDRPRLAPSVAIALLLFALAAVPRLVYVFGMQGYPGFEASGEMERAAANIVREGFIGNIYGDGSGPSAHVAPLYAYWLALWYWVCGGPGEGAWRVQAALCVVVTSLTIALLPAVGRRLGLRPGAGVVGAVLMALLPINLWIETAGSWEQPYTALMMIALLIVFARLQDAHWNAPGLVMLAGVLAGAAALLAPVTAPAVALVLAGEWLAARGQRWRFTVAVVPLVLVAMACLTPWTIRNYRALGGFVPLRSNFGLELWIGNNPDANGKTYLTHAADPERISRQWHPASARREFLHLQELGEVAYMRERQTQAVGWIAQHPGVFAALTWARLVYYWFPGDHMWPPDVPAPALRVATYSLASLGCLAALVTLFWTRHPRRWLLFAFVVGPSLVYLVTHVETRYRYPTFALSVLLTCQAGAVALASVRPYAEAWLRRPFAGWTTAGTRPAAAASR